MSTPITSAVWKIRFRLPDSLINQTVYSQTFDATTMPKSMVDDFAKQLQKDRYVDVKVSMELVIP